MNGAPSQPGREENLSEIDAAVSAVLARRLSELPSGEPIERVVGEVKGEKFVWLGGNELRRRLSLWAPEADTQALIAEMESNLNRAEVFTLEHEDTEELTFLSHRYQAAALGEAFNSDDPENRRVPVCAAFIREHEEAPLPLRGNLFVDELGAERGFVQKLRHELGHAAAGKLFSDVLPPNPSLPQPHHTTDPHGKDPEGYLAYLAMPEEIDVRTRAVMAYLAPEWNPADRLADEREIVRLRAAGKWNLPGEVREITEHFTDEGILWMLNSMPGL